MSISIVLMMLIKTIVAIENMIILGIIMDMDRDMQTTVASKALMASHQEGGGNHQNNYQPYMEKDRRWLKVTHFVGQHQRLVIC